MGTSRPTPKQKRLEKQTPDRSKQSLGIGSTSVETNAPAKLTEPQVKVATFDMTPINDPFGSADISQISLTYTEPSSNVIDFNPTHRETETITMTTTMTTTATVTTTVTASVAEEQEEPEPIDVTEAVLNASDYYDQPELKDLPAEEPPAPVNRRKSATTQETQAPTNRRKPQQPQQSEQPALAPRMSLPEGKKGVWLRTNSSNGIPFLQVTVYQSKFGDVFKEYLPEFEDPMNNKGFILKDSLMTIGIDGIIRYNGVEIAAVHSTLSKVMQDYTDKIKAEYLSITFTISKCGKYCNSIVSFGIKNLEFVPELYEEYMRLREEEYHRHINS